MFEIPDNQNCHSIGAEVCSYCEVSKKRSGDQHMNPVLKRIDARYMYGLNPVFFQLPVHLLPNDKSLLEQNALEIAATKNQIHKIAAFIKERFRLDKEKICLICKATDNSTLIHELIACSKVRGRCLRCFEVDHSVQDCQLSVSLKGVHIKCGLPLDNFSNIIFHTDMECQTTASDRFISCLMFLYQVDRAKVEIAADKIFTGALDFYTWILSRELGLTNGMKLFYMIFKEIL